MSNKVYIASYNLLLDNVNPALNSEFTLQSVGREIKIRSIAVTWRMFNETTGLVIPFDNCVNHTFTLRVNPLRPEIGHPFWPNSGTVPGRNIYIMGPGAYYFDCFYIANELYFTLNVTNLIAATDNVRQNISVIVETEEKTIF
jgi:hypothetical protein